VLASVVVGVIAMLAAVLVLRFWSAPLSVPYDYDGDAAFYLMEVQGLHEHGTYLTNPNLGYPYGQDTRDLPQGVDNLNWLVLRGLSIFGGPAVAMNLFYLLTFGVIGGMAFAVLRLLRIRAVIAGVAALLYAFLPYHLLRRAQHLLLASYGFVPLAVLFALAVLSDRPPLFTGSRLRIGTRGAAARRVRRDGLARRVLRRVQRAAVHRCRRGRRPRPSLVALVVVGRAPLRGRRRRGRRQPRALDLVPPPPRRQPRGDRRYPSETETYGLRIQQLFSPRYGHRNGLLSRLAVKAYSGPIPSELGQTLGIVGAVGVGLLLVVVVVGLVSRPDEPWWDHPAGRTLRHSGMLLLVVVLTATISGFAFFLSAAGMRDIRAWNRAVVVVGFLALLAVATVAETWRDGPTAAAAAGGRAWCSGSARPSCCCSAGTTRRRRSTAGPTCRRLDQRPDALPADGGRAPVRHARVQLPLVSFPESAPVNRIQSYDPARATSTHLAAVELRRRPGPRRTGRPTSTSDRRRPRRLPAPGRVPGAVGRPVRLHRRRPGVGGAAGQAPPTAPTALTAASPGTSWADRWRPRSTSAWRGRGHALVVRAPALCTSSSARSPRAAASSTPVVAPVRQGRGWGAGRARGQRRPSGCPVALRAAHPSLAGGRGRRPGAALPRPHLRRRALRHRALHRSIADPAVAVAELARVTRPGGLVVLMEPGVRRLRRAHDRVTHSARRFSVAIFGPPRSPRGSRSRATGAYSFLVPPAAARRSSSGAVRPVTSIATAAASAACSAGPPPWSAASAPSLAPAGLSVVVVAHRP
jgi:hypothetical protein